MFGKTLSQYVKFEGWVLTLIVLAFILRLGLSASWASMSVIGLIGLLYYPIAIPLTGFGGYKQLLGLLIVQTVVTHGLIMIAIVLGIVTGKDNMFTLPEFFGGSDGKNWLHVLAHVLAILLLPLISWLVAAPILFVTKKLKGAQ